MIPSVPSRRLFSLNTMPDKASQTPMKLGDDVVSPGPAVTTTKKRKLSLSPDLSDPKDDMGEPKKSDGAAAVDGGARGAGPANVPHNAWGLLRSPWNTNPSPFVTRYQYQDGATAWGSLPTCNDFLTCFKVRVRVREGLGLQ